MGSPDGGLARVALTLPGELRIGLADTRNPEDPQTGSGVPAALLEALQEVVGDVVPLSGELPPVLGRLAYLGSVSKRLRPTNVAALRTAVTLAHGAGQLGRPTISARSLLVCKRLAAAGPLDAVVQRGSDMRLPSSYKLVTFEDSTVAQAWRSYPWPHLRGCSEGDIARYRERQRTIYESAIACCCATQWAADSVVNDYGIPADRVKTVGRGQNHRAPAPVPRDWSRPRYLFIGVDWERKNGPAVCKAFARVREHHPDAQLDLVGGHPAIEQPGVITHGRKSLERATERAHVEALYRQATVFVMPSLHEPAGIVYVEAGAAGVPSIGTSNGGSATMICDGGIIVDPLDEEQIFRAMLTLADPEAAMRMGERARTNSLRFTWIKVAERVVRAIALGVPGIDTSGLADFL